MNKGGSIANERENRKKDIHSSHVGHGLVVIRSYKKNENNIKCYRIISVER